MAGINDIKPMGPVWPTPATQSSPAVKDRRQPPKRQPQQQPRQQQDNADKDDDQPNHIDEYA